MSETLNRHIMQKPTEDDLDEFDEEQFEEEFEELFAEQTVDVQVYQENTLQEFVKIPTPDDAVKSVSEGAVIPRTDDRERFVNYYNDHTIIVNCQKDQKYVVCAGCHMGAVLSELNHTMLHWLYGFYLSRPCDQNT